jgi:hypothetical protein
MYLQYTSSATYISLLFIAIIIGKSDFFFFYY